MKASRKQLAGNPSKKPIKKELEYEPLDELPEPPSYLSDEAKQIYRRIGSLLVSKRILTAADIEALSAYADACDLFIKATRDIQKNGTVMITKNGYEMIRPAFSVWKRALEEMRRFATELGLSPYSRSRLQLDIGKAASDDDPLGLLND
jgi:P27 family predicted phage terminase small subunit